VDRISSLGQTRGDFVSSCSGFHFAYQGGRPSHEELSLLEDGGQLLVSFADETSTTTWSGRRLCVRAADMFTELGQSRVIRAHGASQAQIAAARQ